MPRPGIMNRRLPKDMGRLDEEEIVPRPDLRIDEIEREDFEEVEEMETDNFQQPDDFRNNEPNNKEFIEYDQE